MGHDQFDSLIELEERILECRECEGGELEVVHPSGMTRGTGCDFFVIGEGPGNTEIACGEAFSGKGGERLMKWLINAGIGETREQLFSRGYFTSLYKCGLTNPRNKKLVIRKCLPHLFRQLDVNNPSCVVTLGSEPLKALFDFDGQLSEVIGRAWEETRFHNRLFPILSPTVTIVPLPHPSPRSRWLNSPENKAKLQEALVTLRMTVAG